MAVSVICGGRRTRLNTHLSSPLVAASAGWTIDCTEYGLQSTKPTYGRRAFVIAGPSAWNDLPDELRDIFSF